MTVFLDKLVRPNCFLCCDYCPSGFFCEACKEDVKHRPPVCAQCGNDCLSAGICANCIQDPPMYDQALTAYSYRLPISNMIRALKYQHKLETLKALSEPLIEKVKKCDYVLPDCMIPVPLHPRRLMRRGFNQSLELARIISKDTGLDVDFRLLKRTRITVPQFTLSQKQRKTNVKNAFQLRYKPPYRSVAVVDDVITSGATANEIARLLKNTGVERVSIWALAHAGS